MRVLIFSTFNLPPLFVGLNLEFIQRNLDEGNEVFLVNCDISFKECGFNPYKLKYMCEICQFREKKGLELLDGKINKISLKSIFSKNDIESATSFLKNNEIIEKNLTYFNFHVGQAVHSSYISKTREREFGSYADQEILKKLACNSIIIYECLIRYISEKKIEKLFLFNGRWDYYRAALSAARTSNIEVEVFENFRPGGYIEMFGNSLPHNIKKKNNLVDQLWRESINEQEKIKMADKFFIDRRGGRMTIGKIYTKSQTQGKLPAGFQQDKKTFVLFNSSDDEFAAIGDEFKNPYFRDQTEGILFIVDYFKEKKDSQLIIRMHPNLKGLKRDFLDPVYQIDSQFSNIHLVKPEDDIGSYGLVDVADVVLSFGSTIGLEASYWGKPVILLGKGFFSSDVAYIPIDKEDIIYLLKSDLVPHEKNNARKYGYYFTQGGIKTKYYENRENGEIFFKEKPLFKLPLWFKWYYRTFKLFSIKN